MKYTHSFSRHVKARDFSDCAHILDSYRARLQKIAKTERYLFPESSLGLPADTTILRSVRRMVRATVSSKLRSIIVIGIGGSNLGAKAVYDALREYDDVLAPDRFPKLFFVDTLHDTWIAHIKVLVSQTADCAEILIVIISKSGTTTETVAAADVLLYALRRAKGFLKRIVAITDRESPLWKKALQYEWHALEMPAMVGGRFSIFSSAGLFPLAAAGLNIVALRRGACAMRRACFGGFVKKNPALYSAAQLFLHYRHGYIVHDTFIFSPPLESLGRWYRQLLAESIGKEFDQNGKKVNCGIIPTVSVGSTDLHSVAQLYLGGPKKIITTFIRIASRTSVRVPAHGKLYGLVKGIESRPLSMIMDALLDGTQIAYTKAHLPFGECVLKKISEEELGAFFQWKMMEVMYLGRLLNVNAFDQPNVESYKAESRKRLGA